MSIIPLAIEVAKLAIMAIILWFVCEALAMPAVPKRVCQLLIVMIAILASIQMVLAGSPPQQSQSQSRMPSLGPMPNIIAPEKK
jgi:uncharacterized membrane protein YfcA